MKKSLGKIGLIAFQALQIAALVSFPVSQPAQALEFKINKDKLKFKSLSCAENGPAGSGPANPATVKQFCSKYFGSDAPAPSGSHPMAQWTAEDDQMCYVLGAPTNGGYTPASTTPDPAATPVSVGACTTTIPPNVIAATGGDQVKLAQACHLATDHKTQCSLHNSQIESHCLTYLAINGEEMNRQEKEAVAGAKTADYVLLGIDAGVSAACLGECLSPSTVIGAVCSIGATGAGIAELAHIASSEKDGIVGKYINGFASTVVIAGQVGFAAANLSGGGFSKLAGELGNANGDTRYAACATSALFAIMAGVRAISAENMEASVDAECKSINSLLSEATVFDGAGGNATDGASATASNSGWGGSGWGSGSGADGMGGTGTGQRTVGTDTNSQIATCQEGGKSFSECAKEAGVKVLGASDADLLSRMGKVPVLPMKTDDIKKAIKAGGAAGLIGSMLPASAGDAGMALAGLAKASQEHPKELAGLGNLSSGSMYASSGGGASGGGSKSDAANPFANLFGAKDAGPAGGSGQTAFGARAPSTDIWHTGTTQNIFEIVSGKVSQVASRVMKK